MDDAHIVALEAALVDPNEVAARKAFIEFTRQQRLNSGKPVDLEYARMIYYSATRRDNSESLVPSSARARKFIDAMENDVAQKGNLQVALEWFKMFRLKTLGISNLSWDFVKDEVTDYLAQVELRMRAFLSKEELVPIWHPSAVWKSARVGEELVDLTEYLASLAIPCLSLSTARQSTPNLLLYKLGAYGPVDGKRMDKRIEKLIELGTHITLVNTSGSGKTRLLFELLCRAWGFYLVCIWDAATSPYGSSDIHTFTAPSYLQQRRTPTGAPFTPDTKNVVHQLADNVTIAHHVMETILLARLLIFKRFLDVCDELRPTWTAFQTVEDPTARSQRAWALLQAFPRLTAGGDLFGDEDIFLQLTERLQNLCKEDRWAQLSFLRRNVSARGAAPEYLVFDEVQVAATTLKSAFPSTEGKSGRPLLKPIVTSIGTWFNQARLFVAGTHLYKGDVELALASKAFKSRARRTYSNIGGYFRDADILAILRHFFTGPLVQHWGADILREILFWFRGRHRFLTYFIQCVLKEGPDRQSVLNVIANIRYAAAGSPLPSLPGYWRLDLDIRSLIPFMFPLDDGEPGRPRLTNRFTESLEVRTARHAILSFLTTFTYPTYKDRKTLKLVEFGIGRFLDDQDGVVRVSERLVLAALVNYFNDIRNPVNLRTMVQYWLNKRDGLPQVAGYGFELALVQVFWDLFAAPRGSILSDVFDFRFSIDPPGGKTRAASSTQKARKSVALDYTPAWASYRARLIGDFAFNRPGGPRVVQREAFSSPLARRARSAADTLDWFHDMLRDDGREQGMPPFLLPDTHFGPDIAFGLRLEHPTDPTAAKLFLLLLISGKNWETKSKTTDLPVARGGQEVRKAIFTMSPEGLFHTLPSEDKPDKQKAIREVLAAFPALPGTVRPKTAAEIEAVAAAGKEAPKVAAKKKAKKKTNAKPEDMDADSESASENATKQKKEKVVYPYGDVVEFGVLRCLASYPNTVRLPDMTTEQGVYPFATLTEHVMERGDRIGFTAFKEALLCVAPQPAKMDEEIIEDENDLLVAHTSYATPTPSASQEDPGPNPPDAQELVYSDYFGPDITSDLSLQAENESSGEGQDVTGLQERQSDSDEGIEEAPAAERSGEDMIVDDADEDEAMSIYADTPPASARKRQGAPLSEETTPAKRPYRRG